MRTTRHQTGIGPATGAILLLAAVAAAPAAALAAPCGSGATSLENGGFEDPGVPPDSYAQFDAGAVPPWQTTDVFGQIEIWGDGFLGHPAVEGGNFAELNAHSHATVYQDVVTTPGATLTLTARHRGREGADTMRILIGNAAVADVTGDTGWDYVSGDLVNDTTAWGAVSAEVVVPDGQTCTRIAFRTIATAFDNPGIGNLLDDVVLAVAGPPAGPSTAPTLPPTDGTPPDSPARGEGHAIVIALLVLGLAVVAGSRPASVRRA